MKPKVFQYLTLPALQWFRWSALVTVLVGFFYWQHMYVEVDAARMGVSPLSTIGLFLLIWIVAWGILFFVISKAPSGYVLGVITTIVVIAGAWLFVTYTPVGQDDNHVLSIGVGGGFGIIMLFNVWGIIWRNQKKIIQGTLAGTPPANGAALARQAFLASRTNFFLSVPMLFFMATSYHYVIFGR
ncbi:MAG: urate hydroxylase PuuD [Acidobacteriia bacterium]|nr:urate hydroxylase PuuD [Terriglobia bacterium]